MIRGSSESIERFEVRHGARHCLDPAVDVIEARQRLDGYLRLSIAQSVHGHERVLGSSPVLWPARPMTLAITAAG
jgi:hypothetical protein